MIIFALSLGVLALSFAFLLLARSRMVATLVPPSRDELLEFYLDGKLTAEEYELRVGAQMGIKADQTELRATRTDIWDHKTYAEQIERAS